MRRAGRPWRSRRAPAGGSRGRSPWHGSPRRPRSAYVPLTASMSAIARSRWSPIWPTLSTTVWRTFMSIDLAVDQVGVVTRHHRVHLGAELRHRRGLGERVDEVALVVHGAPGDRHGGPDVRSRSRGRPACAASTWLRAAAIEARAWARCCWESWVLASFRSACAASASCLASTSGRASTARTTPAVTRTRARTAMIRPRRRRRRGPRSSSPTSCGVASCRFGRRCTARVNRVGPDRGRISGRSDARPLDSIDASHRRPHQEQSCPT